MKTIIGALALILAAPVAAQAAPAADPHAQHKGMDHSKMDHSKMDHSGHDKGCCKDENKDGKMDCCEKMKQQGQAMECCKKADADKGSAKAADHNGHAGHDH